MVSNHTFSILVIIVTLIPFASCVPNRDSYVARSLLSVNPPCDSASPSPAPAPIANPPEEIELVDSPAWSPEADSPADSISPADSPQTDLDSPAPSPDSISPAASPESPTNPPSEEISMAQSGKTLMNSLKSPLNQPLLSPEIKAICGKTDNATLCESLVTPLLTPDFKPDTSSVLILVIQASLNATKAAKVTVDKLAAAADCQELYDDAVTNLEDAINAVKARDYPTVNTNLSAAMTDYSTCNDGFEETGEPNPLVDVSDKLTKMVSNCLALSTLLK
ncbi:hypothetical protein AALP_AA3G073200 [Arabis alpina]|uniref:Pectinesterase inhibitor domain-containing protein n=1 Tax=Arabis alpina TaxID=50452 RepID=A0A087H7M3_ARAAL|nr:hypothetical protein AALP_AA3G073200 [Arabis alpina]